MKTHNAYYGQNSSKKKYLNGKFEHPNETTSAYMSKYSRASV